MTSAKGPDELKHAVDASAGATVPAPVPDGVRPLAVAQMYRRADLSALSFQSTSELEPVDVIVGQQRAVDAIGFGTRIRQPGFNLFVIGSDGARMQSAVAAVLKNVQVERSRLSDWVYVNNFAEPRKPIAIELPAGRAVVFRDAMRELIDDLKIALPAVFQSEDYQARRGTIDQTFQSKQADAFSTLHQRAASKNIAILRTPMGFALAPLHEGKIVPPEEFNSWPENKRQEVQEVIQSLEQELEQVVRQIPKLEMERRDEIRKLNRDTAMFAVGQSIDEVRLQFTDLPRVIDHLEAVRRDLVDNVTLFAMKPEQDEERTMPDLQAGNPFQRCEVNVLVSHAGSEAARDIASARLIEAPSL